MNATENQMNGAEVVARPWLNSRGETISDVELKALSQSWDAKTWEDYLTWFETQRAESLLPQHEYKKICDEAKVSIFDLAQDSADDDLMNLVSTYMRQLTSQQSRVLELTFWDGRSERFIARQLGISHGAVRRLKFRAIKKISGLLKGGCSSRIMRGEIVLLSKKAGESDGKKVLGLAQESISRAG